jgi:hypothetical protein
MTTISHSQTINAPLSGPTLIQHPKNRPIHIKLGKSFSVTGATQYFVVGSNNVTIEGSKCSTIIVSYAGVTPNPPTPYPGLVQNGSSNVRAYDCLTVKHIKINNDVANAVSLDDRAGWVCQQYFGRNAKDVVVKECTNNGPIANYGSGGIVGDNATCMVSECVNNGVISGDEAAGIVGHESDGTRVYKCKNTATALVQGVRAGGIIGGESVGCSAKRCRNEAAVSGDGAGGIFGNGKGSYSRVNQNNATECKNSGAVTGNEAGGIFGRQHDTSSAFKCYNTGALTAPSSAGQIVSGIFGNDARRCTAEACFNNSNMTNVAGGIFAGATDSTARNCYNFGSLGTAGYGIMNDTSGGANLIDECYVASAAITGQDPIHPAATTSTIVTKYVSGVSEATGEWRDRRANKYLCGTDGTVWIRQCRNEPYKLNLC